ncbi:MFS transporter [Paenibacillus cellulositrophicus]|uniref:MFS transporter n=1 Tax=Paenibacillus cellulositrophicus TaxID=562959 RepID=UPI00203F3357|nr:MFS transporter [Paenibacillus cellulositrophicus]MCM2996915.1 MFS transporter [Paenibacillus cellulositrophicus]
MKLTALFFLIMFMIGTDTFLISPMIPTLQDLYGVPTGMSGWMMGSYTLGAAVFALIAGPLSDGLDRKKVMLLGLLGFAVSTALCGIAADFWMMCLFRLLAGISAAFAAPQVWASIQTLLPAEKKGKAMGLAYAGLAVSQAFGVPIGSWLAAERWSLPFFAIGVLSLLLAGTAFFILPSMKPQPNAGQSRQAFWHRYAPLLGSGKARGAFLAYFLIHLGSNAAFAFLGKWSAERFHLPVDQIGTIMIFLGVGNLAGSLVSGYINNLWTPSRIVAAAVPLLMIGYAALPHLPSFMAASIMYFAIFFILGILFPMIMGVLNNLNPSLRGTISSTATATMNAGTTVGASLAGLLYAGSGGYAAVGIFSACCFAASLLIFGTSRVLAREPVPQA